MKQHLLSLSLAALLVCGAAPALFAQDNSAPPPAQDTTQGPGPGGHHRMDPDAQLRHMTKQLDLSSDQQSQIRPILVDRQQKMQALFQDQSVSRQDRHSKMEAIRQDTTSRIEAVLNDQQKQKFEAMQQRMQNRRHDGGPEEGDGPPPPPEGQPGPQ